MFIKFPLVDSLTELLLLSQIAKWLSFPWYLINLWLRCSTLNEMKYYLQPFTERNLRRCIINWIIQEDEPFTSVEKPSFHQMLSCSSNNKATIISSHSTVKLDCEKMHAFAEKWIKSQLEVRLNMSIIF